MLSQVATLLLLTVTTALAARDCGQFQKYFQFDPPTLVYDAKEPATSFTVVMLQSPNGTAQVALTAPGFQFDTPQVQFTNDNWQTPQTVVAVAASSAISGQASLQIGTTVNAPCLPVHKCPFQYFVNHNTAASQTCTINGDPHFQTFSGAVYSYQGAGGLYYLQSDFLQVQAYQYPCSAGSAVACVGAVTIRYGDSIFVVNGMDKDNNIQNSGGATLTTLGPSGASGFTISPSNVTSATTFTFTTDDGSVVTVNWNSLPYMSVTITLTGALIPTIHGGACAITDGNYQDHIKEWQVPNNDYHLTGKFAPGSVGYPFEKYWGKGKFKSLVSGQAFNDTSYDDVCVVIVKPAPVVDPPQVITYPPFNPNDHPIFQQAIGDKPIGGQVVGDQTAPAAGVPAGGNLAGDKPAASNNTAIAPVVQIIDPNFGKVAQDAAAAAVQAAAAAKQDAAQADAAAQAANSAAQAALAAAAKVAPNAQSNNANVITYHPEDIAAANAQCQQILNVPGCPDLDPNHAKFAQESCVRDVLLSGGHDFSDGHLRGYHARCSQAANQQANSPLSIANGQSAPAASLLLQNGYGDHKCINGCSGNGICTNLGCACLSPFTGLDCTINTSTLPPPVNQPIAVCQNLTVAPVTYAQPVILAQNPVVQAALAQPAASYVPAAAPAAVIPALPAVQMVQPQVVQAAPAAAVQVAPAVAAPPAYNGASATAAVPVYNGVPIVSSQVAPAVAPAAVAAPTYQPPTKVYAPSTGVAPAAANVNVLANVASTVVVGTILTLLSFFLL